MNFETLVIIYHGISDLIEQTLEFVTACVSWTHVYPVRNFIGEKYAHIWMLHPKKCSAG